MDQLPLENEKLESEDGNEEKSACELIKGYWKWCVDVYTSQIHKYKATLYEL